MTIPEYSPMDHHHSSTMSNIYPCQYQDLPPSSFQVTSCYTAMEELEFHTVVLVPCDDLRIIVPFSDRVSTPFRPMMGFSLFATQTTTSGVSLYRIPKNLLVLLPGEKNLSSNILAGEINTSPSGRVWFGESVSAPTEDLKMVRRQRARERIFVKCGFPICSGGIGVLNWEERSNFFLTNLFVKIQEARTVVV